MSEKPDNAGSNSDPQNKSEQPSSEHDSGQGEAKDKKSAGAESTGFKFGSEAPPELQGKTAAEAAQQYDQLKSAVRQYFANAAQPNSNPAYQGYQQPVTSKTPNPETDVSNDNHDPELWFSDPAKAEKALEGRIANMMQQYAAQATAPLAQSSAEAAKHLSKTDPSTKEVWDKYGNEIEQLAANIHPTYKANKALWDQAAKIVKSNHLDELVQEKASQLAASGTGVEGAGGGGSLGDGGGSGPLADLRETDYGRELIEKFGEAGVMRNIEKSGETVESFVAKAKNTHIVRDPDKPGEWKNFSIGQGARNSG